MDWKITYKEVRFNSHLKGIIPILTHVICPLWLGGMLYLLFRSSHLRMFRWVENLGVNKVIFEFRSSLESYLSSIPNWIYNALPDGLWAYSLSTSVLLIWRKNVTKLNFWLMIPIVLSIVPEVLQSLYMFPGTFDIADLILMLFALELSYNKFLLVNEAI